jgi:hypothetical protein
MKSFLEKHMRGIYFGSQSSTLLKAPKGFCGTFFGELSTAL